jgi:hypothetical protein
LIWLRIGTGGRLLWVRWWTFGFHKMRGISWLADDLLASQEGLCSMELVMRHIRFEGSNYELKDDSINAHNANNWHNWLIVIIKISSSILFTYKLTSSVYILHPTIYHISILTHLF